MPAARPAEHLVFYGTLMSAFDTLDELGVREQLRLVGACTLAGRLYDMGEWPSLALGGGIVHGELFEVLDAGVFGTSTPSRSAIRPTRCARATAARSWRSSSPSSAPGCTSPTSRYLPAASSRPDPGTNGRRRSGTRERPLPSVHGWSIASVTFKVDGHTIKVLHKPTGAGAPPDSGALCGPALAAPLHGLRRPKRCGRRPVGDRRPPHPSRGRRRR